MIPRVVKAEHGKKYSVWIEFADGVKGEIDLADELWGEVFEPLKDPDVFAELRVDPELETIVWPCGADFAPEFLYERVLASRSARSPR